MPNAFAYSLNTYLDNKEYKVPFTNVLTYILSCSNKSLSTCNTSYYGSSHFYFPRLLKDKFIKRAVAYS